MRAERRAVSSVVCRLHLSSASVEPRRGLFENASSKIIIIIKRDTREQAIQAKKIKSISRKGPHTASNDRPHRVARRYVQIALAALCVFPEKISSGVKRPALKSALSRCDHNEANTRSPFSACFCEEVAILQQRRCIALIMLPARSRCWNIGLPSTDGGYESDSLSRRTSPARSGLLAYREEQERSSALSNA